MARERGRWWGESIGGGVASMVKKKKKNLRNIATNCNLIYILT